MDGFQFSYLGQEEHEEEHDDFRDDDEENIQNGRRYRGKDLDWRLSDPDNTRLTIIFTTGKLLERMRKSRNIHVDAGKDIQFLSVTLHPVQEPSTAAWSFSVATSLQISPFSQHSSKNQSG